MLDANGLVGTFYASTGHGGRRLISDGDIERVALRHELGNHGWTHRFFTTLDRREIEEELQRGARDLSRFGPVASIVAPPGGKMNAGVVSTLQALGYSVRSAPVLGSRLTGPLWLEPSFLFRPIELGAVARNAVRRRTLPALPLLIAWSRGRGFRDQARRILEAAARTSPAVHIWGHASLIERLGLWDELKFVLEFAAKLPIVPVTNSELLAAQSELAPARR
jgi:peptidoglycan/xylan/chitin deacetylase (PgdA/CDA1 family)